MKEKIEFSILVAHYNNTTFLKECLKSIKEQTFQDFEVIILDDFSTEEEYKILKKMIENDTKIKLYRNTENRRVGYTKRKLIELATGTICGFVDPDDTIVPNALEIMIEEHNKNPEASIVNSNLNFCDKELKPFKSSQVIQIEQNDPYFFNFKGYISHFASFKKEYYQKTKGIDSYFRIAEDQDLYLKLYEVGESIQIKDVLYNYRLNPNSITNSSKKEVSSYWHWVAAIKTAERRGINIEDLFIEKFVQRNQFIKIRQKVDLIKKSRLLKLLHKIGLFKAYKYL